MEVKPKFLFGPFTHSSKLKIVYYKFQIDLTSYT